ncbi:MAG: PaaI family thioesterase [Desulfobacterales bacterium]
MKLTQTILNKMNRNSLYHVMGIQVQEAHGGKARSRLQPKSAICWPFPQQPHGGVLFTLMDTTMAWAVWSQLDDGYNCTTVNLDIHYTRPAKSDAFLCTAWSTYKAGRISFVRADIRNPKDQLVAMGQGAFRIIPVDLLK